MRKFRFSRFNQLSRFPSLLVSEQRRRRTRGVDLVCRELETRALLTTGFQTIGIVPGELLVQYESGFGVQQRALNRLNAGAGLAEEISDSVTERFDSGMMERLTLPSGMSVESARAWFGTQPGVKYAEPNYMIRTCDISNDPYYTSGRLWNMEGSGSPVVSGPSGTTNPNGVNAEAAWQAGSTGSSSVVVGIVDTGIQIRHPELAQNIWVNPYDAPDGIDNDGNGYVDDVNGWDFLNNDNTVYDGLTDAHGTHVAGVIGAQGGNGVGVAGVNWNVSMISAKFMSSVGGTTADAVRAIDYLTDLKIRHGINLAAINASWGSGDYSQAMQDAILRSAKADILFVAAAGNDRDSNDQTPFYPASFNTLTGTPNESAATFDSVISVTAIASDGGLAFYSNTGLTSVDIAAPGSSIISTIPNNSYGTYSGTSMAAPHVTGAIALYASAHPGASAADIKSAIFDSARTSPSLVGKSVTGGVLDVAAALRLDPPSSPGVSQITITDITLKEGQDGTAFAVFTIGLNKTSATPITLNYATADGSAVAGTDYTAVSGTLTFEPGSVSKTVQVPVTGDSVIEDDEKFYLNLSNASANALISRDQATATILNDDVYVPQVPTIQIADASMAEGNRGLSWMSFEVTRTGDLGGQSSIVYYTSAKTARAFSDFLPTAGIVRFSPGESSKVIRVQVYGDRLIERDESFNIVISSAVNAKLDGNLATGTILDDDRPQSSGESASASSGTAGNKAASVSQVVQINVYSPKVTPVSSLRGIAGQARQFYAPPRSLPVLGPRPGGPARPKYPVRPI